MSHREGISVVGRADGAVPLPADVPDGVGPRLIPLQLVRVQSASRHRALPALTQRTVDLVKQVVRNNRRRLDDATLLRECDRRFFDVMDPNLAIAFGASGKKFNI